MFAVLLRIDCCVLIVDRCVMCVVNGLLMFFFVGCGWLLFDVECLLFVV